MDERIGLGSASASGRPDLAMLALSDGERPEASAKGDPAALSRAAESGNFETLAYLIAAGADTNRKDEFGRTAPHYAAASGSSASVMLLLDANASPNISDFSGWTPLHDAAWSGDRQTVERLISAGASVSIKTEYGWTAGDVAEAESRKLIPGLEMTEDESRVELARRLKNLEAIQGVEERSATKPKEQPFVTDLESTQKVGLALYSIMEEERKKAAGPKKLIPSGQTNGPSHRKQAGPTLH